jgi:hypothetical protein
MDTARYFIGGLSGFALVPTAFNAGNIVRVTARVERWRAA